MPYIVKVSSVKRSNSGQSKCAHIALIEVEPGFKDVSMISLRAKGVLDIVKCTKPLHVGITERSEFVRALNDMNREAAKLNRKEREEALDAPTGYGP